MATPGKAMSFMDMVQEVVKKQEEIVRKHDESGGLCTSCTKSPSNLTNQVESMFPYLCAECTKEVEDLVGELQKDSGFTAMQIKTQR